MRRRGAFLADPALQTDLRAWVTQQLRGFAECVGGDVFGAAVAEVGHATAAALGLA